MGVAMARSIICALALYGVNAREKDVREAAQSLYYADFKDLHRDFLESDRQDQDETPMTLNDFLVACVDAVFNTDITVKNWWPQLKKERRKLGDLFLKTILNMLRAKGGAWAPSGEYAQLGVQDSNLSRKLGKAVNLPGHPLVQNFKVTSYLQESLQLASQLNSLHSGEYATQDTVQGMQVPDAFLLQGGFLAALFKNSIQYTIVGTLKSWDQGESN